MLLHQKLLKKTFIRKSVVIFKVKYSFNNILEDIEIKILHLFTNSIIKK